MQFNPDNKKAIIALLKEGRRTDAGIYIQRQFDVTPKQAEQLLQILESEIRQQKHAGSAYSKGCHIKILQFFMIITGLIGSIFLLATLITWYSANHYADKAVRITGKVVALQPETDGNSVAAVVEYTFNGEVKYYQSNFFSNPPAYNLQEEVTLLVNPDNPEEVVIDSFSERYSAAFFFGLFSFMPLLMTLGLYLTIRKLSRRVAL